MKPMRTIKSVLIIVCHFISRLLMRHQKEVRIGVKLSPRISFFHIRASMFMDLQLLNCPTAILLSAWFQGSGERWADDVKIMGSRLVKGDTAWSKTFVMADVDGFPDINPIMFMDLQQRLWLMWYPVLANQWESSIPMYRISDNYKGSGAPVWSWQDVLFVKVGDKTERGIQPGDRFVQQVSDQLKEYEQYLNSSLIPDYAG